MENSEPNRKKRTLADIAAPKLEWIKANEGVYYLYGSNGHYLETCVYYDADKRKTTILLKDLDRLAEYVPDDVIPWNWLRRNGITNV